MQSKAILISLRKKKLKEAIIENEYHLTGNALKEFCGFS